MKARITFLTLLIGVAIVAPVAGEQIRLRTGDFLQGDIIGERSNEEILTIRLYRTGGVFSLKWEQLTVEDEARIRESLGLATDVEEEVETVEGHLVLLRDSTQVIGLVTNPEAKSGPVEMRLSTGPRSYPREFVAKITPTLVPALAVHSAEELYARYIEKEGEPEGGDAQVRLAEYCMRINYYEKAKVHFDLALEDEELPDSRVQNVKNRLTKVEVYIQAKDATDRVRQIKRLRFQKRFDQALEEVNKLLEEYAEEEEILKVLRLDRLRRQVTADREKYFRREIQRRFFRTLDRTIRDKVRDDEVGLKDAQLWSQTPKGLAQEVFDKLAADLEIEAVEAREFFDNRSGSQIKRYNYGSGTFIHPEMQAKARKLIAGAKAAQRNQARNQRNRGAAGPRRQQERPKTADEWWNDIAGTKDREKFVRAWFAETGGVLSVLRFETKPCRNCSGTGLTKSIDPMSNEEIQRICTQCNLSGGERVVICK